MVFDFIFKDPCSYFWNFLLSALKPVHLFPACPILMPRTKACISGVSYSMPRIEPQAKLRSRTRITRAMADECDACFGACDACLWALVACLTPVVVCIVRARQHFAREMLAHCDPQAPDAMVDEAGSGAVGPPVAGVRAAVREVHSASGAMVDEAAAIRPALREVHSAAVVSVAGSAASST